MFADFVCKVGCEAFWRNSIFAYRDNTRSHYVVARRARRKGLDDWQLQSVANKTSTLIHNIDEGITGIQ